MEDIRQTSAAVAVAVAKEAREAGLGRILSDDQLVEIVAKAQWNPEFVHCVPSVPSGPDASGAEHLVKSVL
jgi:malic enzyme